MLRRLKHKEPEVKATDQEAFEWPADKMEQLTKVFNQIATHGGKDGAIDKGELIAAWYGVDEEVQKDTTMFDEFDTDNTGELNLEEFSRFVHRKYLEEDAKKAGLGDFWFKVFMGQLLSNLDDIVNGVEYETDDEDDEVPLEELMETT